MEIKRDHFQQVIYFLAEAIGSEVKWSSATDGPSVRCEDYKGEDGLDDQQQG